MPAKLSDIKPNGRNPRFIKKDRDNKLDEYIDEYGDLSGLVFNKDLTIISAHQRHRKFLKKKGKIEYTERYDPPQVDGTIARGFVVLPDGKRFLFREVDWPQEKADRATIVANGQFGELDSDALTNQWSFDVPELREFGVPEFVFGGAEIAMPEPEYDELVGEGKDKPASIKITFPTPDDLQRCEAELQEVLNRICPDAYYSVSAGEI